MSLYGRGTDNSAGLSSFKQSDMSGNAISEMEVKLLLSESPPPAPPQPCYVRRGKLFYASVSLGVLALALVLAFTVVVPAVVRSQIGSSSISVLQANVIGPTNTSFQSLVVEQFSRGAPVPTTIHFDSLHIEWEGAGGGTLVSLTSLPDVSVSSSPISMGATATVVNVTALTDFNYFAVNNDETEWRIRATADVTALGVKTRVDIDKYATMRGFDNFPIPPSINNLTTLAGFPTYLQNRVEAALTSNSNIAIYFEQDLHFSLISHGIKIGRGVIPNAAFKTGTFDLGLNIFMEYTPGNDEEYSQLMAVLSNYSGRVDSPVTLTDFHLDEPVSWLLPSLNTLSLDTVVPGVRQPILQSIELFKPLNVETDDIFVQLNMHNPTQAPLNVTSIQTTVYYHNVTTRCPCGEYAQPVKISLLGAPGVDNPEPLSIVIPPMGNVTSKPLVSTKILRPFSEALAALAAFQDLTDAGEGLFDIHSEIMFQLGDFPASVAYWQYNVPVHVTYVTAQPSLSPTRAPTRGPTRAPTGSPTRATTEAPTGAPTGVPTASPTTPA